MDSDNAIKVENVSKAFKLPREKNNSLKSAIINSYRRNRSFEMQQVLKSISFEIKKGEFFGVVGRNGSGKSTLLKLLAGIYSPDRGIIQINGSLTPFIELGVGFNPELTGRENVFLNGALLGFNRKEMNAMYKDIVSFAELAKFMDQKLKNYSSGMQVRLAFSIAIRTRSDILLLDEVLAVGDAAFQKKCFDYFRQLKKDKQTVVFISHDMNAVREYCDRAVLIDSGKIIMAGGSDKIADAYTRMFMEETAAQKTQQGSGSRWGTQAAVIQAVRCSVDDKKVTIDLDCQFNQDVERPIFGLTIYNPIGLKVFESNTKWKKYATSDYKKDQKVSVRWSIDNVFTNGVNYITPAIASSDGTEFYDHWEEAASFRIDKDEVTTAVILPDSSVEVKKAA